MQHGERRGICSTEIAREHYVWVRTVVIEGVNALRMGRICSGQNYNRAKPANTLKMKEIRSSDSSINFVRVRMGLSVDLGKF